MTSRRSFLKTSLIGSSALLLGGSLGSRLASAAIATPSPSGWRMPDEGDPHTATWMAFGASQRIWGRRLLVGAQDNLGLIASTIAQFEPVNMLVREKEFALAQRKCGAKVNLIVQPIDDLWLRDTGPVFVKNTNGQLAGVDFNFNGWGGKQASTLDGEVANAIAAKIRTSLLSTNLILEGGGIEVDGEGTAIITESCVLNANRNPNVSKAQCEAELMRLLGVSKIIWLPGIAGKDITDGHTDFYARFSEPGVVVAGFEPDTTLYDNAVTKRHLDILRNATDAKGRKLEVVVLNAPSYIRPKYESNDFAAGYINFYLCNGAVIAPEFGDAKADKNCRDILLDLFPNREVVQLNIDAIAAGGGGIHCTTQQQPL